MSGLFNMFSNRGFFVTALTLSLLMISLTFIEPAMASSKGGGSVTQEKVSTGDSGLDKQINKFYSCISKTHQDPPTIEKVDSCYYQGVGGSGGGGGGTSNADIGIGSGDSSTPSSTSDSHHHKHGNNEGASDNSGVTGSGDISAPLPVSSGHHHKD
jgi:hypothetical protein